MNGFDSLPAGSVEISERVAYRWMCSHTDPREHTIRCLYVWHRCTHGRWLPTGVGAHTLIAVDPLHIEASVYWPDCCGLHGFIRDGRWTGA